VTLHHDWTQAERASWGGIKDAATLGHGRGQHDLALATLFDRVAAWGLGASRISTLLTRRVS
jgi:hypothetical protein